MTLIDVTGRLLYGGGDDDTVTGNGAGTVYTDQACTVQATDLVTYDRTAATAVVAGTGSKRWFAFYGPVGHTGPLWSPRDGGPPLRIDPDPSSTYAPIPSGAADATKFYRGDGTWAVPAGAGSSVTVSTDPDGATVLVIG